MNIELMLFMAVCIILLVWFVATDKKRVVERVAEQKAAIDAMPMQHCMTCGHDFKPTPGALRGNKVIEVVLWITFLWPIALVYSIWRRLDVGKAKLSCPSCSSNTVVPATSPAATAHKKLLFA